MNTLGRRNLDRDWRIPWRKVVSEVVLLLCVDDDDSSFGSWLSSSEPLLTNGFVHPHTAPTRAIEMKS